METNNNELYHWGIFGMKWGVRRYQNPDGTLTPEGRKRYRKSAKEMTDEELSSAIVRLTNEKRYTDLVRSMQPEHRTRTQKVIDGIGKGAKIASPILKPFGKAYTYGMEKLLTKAIDNHWTSEEDKEAKKLEKELTKRKNESEIAKLERESGHQHLKDEAEKAKLLSEIASAQATAAEKDEILRRAGLNTRSDGTNPFYDYLNKSGGHVSKDDALILIADSYNMTVDDIKKALKSNGDG